MNRFQRIFNLFETAKENGLKYPKIRLRCPTDERILVLGMAGKKSVAPGSITITSPGGFGDNQYYGRISTNGAGNWNKHETTEALRTEFEAVLTAFANSPEETAKLYGHETGFCCFCATKITTDESLTAGYGPTCAEKYGLPWGNKTNANQVALELDFPNVPALPITEDEALIDISAEIAEWRNGQISDHIAFDRIYHLIREVSINGE